jgi:alcohol dehydrogenase class IV
MIGISIMNHPNGLNWSISQVLATKTKLSFHQSLSLMLPYVLEYNLTNTANKLVLIARCMGEKTEDISVAEAAITAIEAIRKLLMGVNLPTNLSEFYINRDHISDIAHDVSKFTHMEGVLKKTSAQEIESILMTAL